MSDTAIETRSMPTRLLAHARRNPRGVALRHKQLGISREYTWVDYSESARRAGLAVRALGVGPGDVVAVLSENRPEWVFADVGTQGVGAVTAGIYPTSPAAEVRYILEHSGAKVLVAEDEEQYDKAIEVWDDLPNLSHVVVIDPRGVKTMDDPRLMTFEESLELGARQDPEEYERLVAGLDPQALAILVYTSGTTGPPKGAMISHRNMHTVAESIGPSWDATAEEEILSYLPLCHVAERAFTVMGGLGLGYTVNFGEGGDAFPADLREVQPTFFLGVPRVWERMMASVQIRTSDATRFKRANFRYWMKKGGDLAERRMRGEETTADRIWYRLGWLFLYRALRDRLGLSRLRMAISGAAPIAPAVLEFFWAMGVDIREGYGQTENTAQGTITPRTDVRLGSVGVPVEGVEVRIADDGEIVTRGEGTFLGYYNNPAATAETIADGWLHTGDIGEIRADGHLYITDRKKDIIITAGGKNISPSEIENLLKVSPYVREAVVIGDRRKYLTALIGIESDTVGDWATRAGVPYTTYEDLASKDEVHELVDEVVRSANAQLAQVETIKYFQLLPVELDHEDGQLTATQKVKRSAIADQFADMIEGMYG